MFKFINSEFPSIGLCISNRLMHFCIIMDVADLYKMLEDRRRELGLSQAEVELRAFGKTGNASFQAIRRGAAPSFDRLSALGNALNLEFYFGPPRPEADRNELIGSDFVRIPRYDVELSAGAGAENHDNLPSSSLAFRLDWLNRMGINSKKCVIVGVKGDSMEPTLYGGDLVMLDRQANLVKDMRLFGVVDIDGTAKVKRLQKLDGQLILHSDNKTYRADVRSARDANAMTIIGQVVWSGHDFER